MKHKVSLLAAACLVSLFAGCGGGSGGDDPAANVTTLSGTVAAGAPLVGFLAVKDATGTVVTSAIDESGHYAIDTEALTPPLVLFASGVAGGHAYTIASVATSADLGGTVNVTPLTDLVVANMAGSDSAAFFNDPDFSLITAAAISDAETLLQQRLQPLLDAASLPGDIDLLHTPFSADRSGMDGVLDLISVSVDPDTDTATISYALDGTVTLTDDLADPGDSSIIDTSGVDVSGDAAATRDIAATVEAFNALFADGTPTADAVGAYFDDAFMLGGVDKATAVAYFTSSDPEALESATADRLAMQNFSLVSLDTASSPQTATVRYGEYDMNLVNADDSGYWKFSGNGDRWDATVHPETHLYQSNNTVLTGLNFTIWDNLGDELQNGDYFIVQGAGLPPAGVVLVQYDFNDFGNANSTGNINYGYNVTDAIAAAIADGDTYTFTRYRDLNGDTNVYASSPTPVTVSDAATLSGTADDVMVDDTSRVLIKRPLLSTETANFATVTAPTQAELENFSSGTLDVAWTLPSGSRSDDVVFDRRLSDGTEERAAEKFMASTALSTTLDVPPPGTTVDSQTVTVFTIDVFGRTVATNQDVGNSVTPVMPGGAITGAWRYVNGAEFQYLIVFDDGTYLYAENDLTVQTATENGVEVGTYTYDEATGALSLNVVYDDNTAPDGVSGSGHRPGERRRNGAHGHHRRRLHHAGCGGLQRRKPGGRRLAAHRRHRTGLVQLPGVLPGRHLPLRGERPDGHHGGGERPGGGQLQLRQRHPAGHLQHRLRRQRAGHRLRCGRHRHPGGDRRRALQQRQHAHRGRRCAGTLAGLLSSRARTG